VEARIDPVFQELAQPDALRVFAGVFRRWIESRLSAPSPALSRALARLAWRADRDSGEPLDELRKAAWNLAEWRDFDRPWEKRPFARDAHLAALIDAAEATLRIRPRSGHLPENFGPLREFVLRVQRARSAGLVDGDRIEEHSSDELAAWRAATVGFIFQSYNLMPVLSAQKNVELPLLLTDLSGGERAHRASVALELVGLADRASHKPNELSGGQQQRVAIARALVSDPRILICDEPTGDLDRKTADEILRLLQDLNANFGKTIVMVTHDPQAAKYARRTVHLDKGTLVDDPGGH